MAASISELPPELLNLICNYMHTKQEIANFSQCSRQFRAVAAPHLYRHIDLLSTSVFNHALRKDAVSHRVEALVRTFLRDRNLGLMVRHLAIRLPEVVQNNGRALTPLDPQCEDVVKAILPDSLDNSLLAQTGIVGSTSSAGSVDSGSDWEEANGSDWESTDESADEDEVEILTNHNESIPVFETEADRWIYLAARSKAIRGNVMFTILLSCIPGLATLDLEMPSDGWRTGFLDRALQRDMTHHNAPSQPSPSSFLANLRHICFGYTSPLRRGESWVGPFVLPSLEQIYLHNLSSLGPILSFVRPQSLNITHLELRDCRVPATSLIRLLSSPKALKTFIYIVGEEKTREDHFAPISYRSLRLSMEKQKDSLEEIWLDYPHDYHWGNSTSQNTAPMGSLTAFTKLKHLRIAGTYIFGFVWTSNVDERRLVRALPEQLETLCLCHADEDDETIDGITFVLDAKKTGRFPELREITLEAGAMWHFGNRRDLAPVLELAESVGVYMKLIDNHSDQRLEEMWERTHAALHFMENPTQKSRRESPWGFYREKSWPVRVSGIMQMPQYRDITENTRVVRASDDSDDS
ncbi:hypothetical protein PFICI_10752 [Pestalotiopsis fici W106-1]|uniref:F-box domain-containing protein n=1 Tax=Pestalotiopsis fici (strain W106-1 / CGMCC3.15140) TaxID=1229662 RepID=W3WSN6_PESFW|nr:uncharacterized protein PFICI_10752 [Pestalotiopsis fici W106-1]ETS76878.1 hypothetical protein PFICI_10752 [Pestalotiopsis fici W106-1]